MHSDHEVFQRGVLLSRKVKLTFFSKELGRELVRWCGPLCHSRGRDDAEQSECYYLWDFEAREGYNFTALSPSEIVGMELTEEVFNFGEIRDSSQKAGS